MVKTKINSKKLKTYIFIVVMLLIPVSNFLIFWLGVNFNSILMAFQNEKFDGTVYWTMNNFKNFFQEFTLPNSSIITSVKNTGLFFASNIFIVFPISLVLCYFLYKKIMGYKFFRFVFYLPSIISAVVLAGVFKEIISTDGVVGTLMTKLGKEPVAYFASSKTAIWAILIYNVTFSFGGNLILLSGAMSHISEDVVEAARLDGVGMVREMVQIVIPLIWPTLTTLLIFQVVGIFSASGPILLFTQGDKQTSTLAYWIYEQVKFAGQYYYASAVGLVMTAVATPLAMLTRWGLNKTLETVEA